MRWKSILLCLLLVSPVYGKGFSLPKSKKRADPPLHFPIKLKMPSNWERIDDPKQLPEKIKLLYLGKGKGQFAPSINLACEQTEMTLDQYITLAKQYHEGQPDTSCRQLGIIETKAGEGKLLQIDRQTEWGNLRFLQVAIVVDGIAYVITATATHEEYPSLYPHFYQAFQSFETEHNDQTS